MAESYDSARLKLNRAQRLISELDNYITTYRGAAIVSENDAWLIRVKEDPAPHVQSLLGDAVHNLRVALDHAAVEAVRLNDGNPKNVYFPFSEDASQIDIMIKKRNFHRASDKAIALVKGLEPYPGGNAALRAIHDLDVADKHHSLIAFSAAAKQGADLAVGGVFISGSTFGGFRDGLGIIHFPGQAPPLKPVPVHLIAKFGKGEPLAGSELVPTLTSLSELVEGVIESLATL